MYLPKGNKESLLKYFLSKSIISRKKKFIVILLIRLKLLFINYFLHIKLVLGNTKNNLRIQF